ncbi:AMP deaminase [Balamuthia mandrillaris]
MNDMMTLPAGQSFTGFEGAEKKLLVRFSTAALSQEDRGLRKLPRSEWSKVLDLAHCTILSHTPNQHFDAYVLSESSLFVYRNQVILKTCGTSSLLLCLPEVLRLAKDLALSVEFVFYSRRNFLFPERQPAPHTSFVDEVVFLKRYFANGQDSTFGPTDGDHWNVFVADYRAAEQKVVLPEHRFTYEITMTRLDEAAMKQFYKESEGESDEEDNTNSKKTGENILVSSGISELVKGALTDEFLFEPCGFSMNALHAEAYYSMHITPEPHCSFISFETNNAAINVCDLTKRILDLFKPGRLVLTQIEDRSDCPRPQSAEDDAEGEAAAVLSPLTTDLSLGGAYKETCRAGHDFGGSSNVQVWSFVRGGLHEE